MSTSSTYGAMDTFVTRTRITDVTADDFDDLMYRNTNTIKNKLPVVARGIYS